MPDSLDPTIVDAKNMLRSATPWVWLLEIRVSASEAFRFAAHDAEVTFDGFTFAPFPCKLSPQEQTSHGVLTNFNLEVSNLSREVVRRIDGGEVIDEILSVKLVNLDNLDSAAKATYVTRYRILDAAVNLTTVRFGLGQWNLYNSPFPAETYRRTKCRFRYGGPRCGYDTGRTGAITDCDFTLEGTNGCEVHGDDEAAAGLLQSHPRRYGAQPAIPTGSSRS